MKIKTSMHLWLILGLVLTLTACGPKEEAASNSVETTNNALLLETVPESAPSLIEAVASAETGSTLLFTGRVGGVLDPLSKDYAAFVVADELLQFCDEMGDAGHCKTPWDACCEDSDKIAASRAFVQFVDVAGNPLTINLAEAIGLSANDTVIVKGKLSPDSTPANRIILADGLSISRQH